MEHLSHRDLNNLISALGILHTDTTLETLPERTLAAVSSLIKTDIVTFDGFDVAAHYTQTQWHNNGELLTPQSLEIFPLVAHEHPLIPELVGKKRQDVLKITDVISQEEFEQTALFNEFFRRVGVNRQMGMALTAAQDFTLSCAVNRSGRDFSETERTLLNLLAPHLLAAVRNAYFFKQIEVKATRFEKAAEWAQTGIIALAGDGQILFVSEPARATLGKYFADERFDSKHLPETLRRWAKTNADATDIKPPLVIKNSNGELRISLTSNSRANEYLLMLKEIRRVSPASLAPLGLTKRETDVLFWMMKDKTNAEIAALCGISPPTVKKHAENIYLKLGVGSRTAAVVKALEIL